MLADLQLTIVNAGWGSETLAALGEDLAAGTPARTVAKAYIKAIKGSFTGEVLDGRAPAGQHPLR